MQTIPKRPDLYTNPTDSTHNIEKQMSQLLQIRNLLNQKFKILTENIIQDTYAFTHKNYPKQNLNPNLTDLKNNLFGNNRSFQQFHTHFKQFMTKLQSQIKGVVETMQKFSFTKNIALFINNGIMDSFLKVNNLMLQRQQFCQNLFNNIQNNLMNGTSIFSKHFRSDDLCKKCKSNLQKQKLVSTKQSMILGGPKISELFKRELYMALEEEGQNSENDIYSQMLSVKTNVKNIEGNLIDEIRSEEDIKHNLERLQSNLQRRKYDILACLIEMGQFGSTLIKSSDVIEKLLRQNAFPKQEPKFASLLPKVQKLPPKFNFKQFTFDVSKHFYKEIKDIEAQLTGIKKKYKTLIESHNEQYLGKQVQCDIGKEHYEKQIEKYKKKTQRQISALNDRIKEIQGLNREYKGKIEQYDNALKSHIFKINENDNGIEKIPIKKGISQLVGQYEKKIRTQQQELKHFRQSKLKTQDLVKLNEFIMDEQNGCLLQQNESVNQLKLMNDKNILIKKVNKQVRKKVSLFLQPIIKKILPNQQKTNKINTEIKEQSSIHYSIQKNNQQSILVKDIPIRQVLSSAQNLIPISQNDKPKYLESNSSIISTAKKVQYNLKIYPNLINIHVDSSPLPLHMQKSNHHIQSHNPHKLNLRNLEKRQSQVVHPRQMQILTDLQQNKLQSHFVLKQNQLKIKDNKNHKLTKVKSQENTKSDKFDKSYEEKDFTKQIKKIELSPNEGLKRISSQYLGLGTNDKKLSLAINKNTKQKFNKKTLKTLSLTILKKGQQDQSKSTLKLPSISQYERGLPLNKTQKQKQSQKVPQMNSKTNLLVKKKRKKRNFSQQTLNMQSLYNNNGMTMSLGCNLQKQVKNKPKKEYIIDFIPKIDESNVSKCKQDHKVVIESHILQLFDIKQGSMSDFDLKRVKKSKYYTKTVLTKQYEGYVTERLKKQEIQLSTKIYSLMVALKSTEFPIYKSIREKLRQQFDKKVRIKTNCDNTSMTNDHGENNTTHLPLSLSFNPGEMEECDNLFQFRKEADLIKQTNGYRNESSLQKMKQQGMVKITKPDKTQLSRILNFLIIKHRNMCLKDGQQNNLSPKNICNHLLTFYQYLLLISGKNGTQTQKINQKK